MSCVPANCSQITAIYFMNRLIIRARGTKPTPCHTVKIRRSPNRIFPPEYVVETCSKPVFCIEVIAPFDVTEVFLAPQTATVRVHCAEGTKVVPVQVVATPTVASSLKLLSAEAAPCTKREAVGYSETLNFTEAFEDALQSLPPDTHPFPDKLIAVKVTEIGGLFGGIAGVHKMFVRIEAE